ncbi:MAG: hypothetical protein HY554_14030 [Elusimicrobia bacterium]|nr:hypothetical protein [Elusimicrobiota bacterium]
MTERRGFEPGQILPGVLAALLILMIFVPAMVYLVQNEAKHTVKQKRSTVAFYAAMAGVDRALYVLKASTTAFDDVLDGDTPSGYQGDTIYTDIPTGSYKVWMTSTTTSKQIAVYGYGRDDTSNEFRTIEVLLQRDGVVAAIYAPAITSFGNATVWWGPMMSKGNMQMQGAANNLYPRKLARGSITISGGGSPASRDSNSAAPNTDGLEWWSYNEPPGVPDAQDINLDYYREAAKDEVGCPAGGTPAGSCYYTSNQSWSNHTSTVSRVYFFEANASFTGGKHFRGFIVVMGNVSFSGSGQGASGGVDYGEYIAAIPAEAYKEYQKNTPQAKENCVSAGGSRRTSGCAGGGPTGGDDGNYANDDEAEADDGCCHQYPGDDGLRSTETWKFGAGCVAHGDFGNAPTGPVHVKGYIWVRGSTTITGNAIIHGSLYSDSGSFSGGGTADVFFDDTLEVQVKSITISQVSWKELPGRPF